MVITALSRKSKNKLQYTVQTFEHYDILLCGKNKHKGIKYPKRLYLLIKFKDILNKTEFQLSKKRNKNVI